MKNKNITITISAPAGVGKTTIAEMLNRFLTEQGFDSIRAKHEVEPKSYYTPENYNRRVESIKEQASVIIVENQEPRSRSL